MYARQMPIDADLLEQARAAEARVIDAERTTEVARADFHHAVRRLQLAGASLREIAAALNLSYQRVHQIVDGAGGSRRWRRVRRAAEDLQCCSFCGKNQKQVKKLIAGPNVFICETCIATAHAVLTTTDAVAGSPIERVSEEASTERCGFCGKRRYQVSAMASAVSAHPSAAPKAPKAPKAPSGPPRICTECLGLCHEILDAELA